MTAKRVALIAFFTVVLIAAVYGVDGEVVCKDTIYNCADFNVSLCQSSRLWAEQNCAIFCGICTDQVERDANGCPKGWVYFEPDHTCLKVFGKDNFGERNYWPAAREVCQRNGADLVVIKNKEKNAFVLDLLRRQSKWVFLWIGLSNIAQNGFMFQYADGSFLGDYHPWLLDAPDNLRGTEKCVYMWPMGEMAGQWNDYECLRRMCYACEMPSRKIETGV